MNDIIKKDSTIAGSVNASWLTDYYYYYCYLSSLYLDYQT